MANVHKGEYGLEVEGKNYVLRYSADTVCDLEDQLQMTLSAIGEQMRDPDKMKMSMVRTMFIAGLADKHGDMDEAARRTLFKALSPVDAVKHVATAFAMAFGVEEEAAAGAANPPRPGLVAIEGGGTGPASSATGAG